MKGSLEWPSHGGGGHGGALLGSEEDGVMQATQMSRDGTNWL
jgi:hypothetical protein